ncbi:MAG TPA: hypothetical protein VKM55_28850 [Candidatus Lokiarchaeia archaeon]|nr:hypothetical protein [Candidatus Lokiarchaeia archaeon]
MPALNETKIIDLFKTVQIKGEKVHFKGDEWRILLVDKPRVNKGRGEPKTDVFIRLANENNNNFDIKLSLKDIKKEDSDLFVENKITPARLNEIFQQERIDALKPLLLMKFREHLSELKPIDMATIKHKLNIVLPLGWRCDILINDNRALGVQIQLTEEEAVEIYSGEKRPSKYRDAVVNGHVIPSSGVANYILKIQAAKIGHAQSVLDNMQEISRFIQEKDHRNAEIAPACLNFRIQDDPKRYKWDGPRPLIVAVDWQLIEGTLQGVIDLVNIFQKKGNDTGRPLEKLVKTIDKKRPILQEFASLEKQIHPKLIIP